MSVSWFDSVTITVEASFNTAISGFGLWDGAIWDTGTWGPDTSWTDISSYVLGFSTRRAFSRDVYSWQAGTATLTLANADGRFSPTNLAGPYASGTVTGVRPWRPIRITAAYGGTTYAVYRGYAISWQDGYEPSKNIAVMTVQCVDEMASLARYDSFEQSAAGGGELFGLRIHRVLDNASHHGNRTVDEGVVTMQSTTLAQNCVSELKLTSDSEGGTVWIDSDGTFVASDQEYLIRESASTTSQATYDDTGAGLPYAAIATAYDGDHLVNVVSFARSGGTEQTYGDTDSRALYGDKKYSRSDLICSTDAEVAALALQHLTRNKAPELRIESVTFRPRGAPSTLFPEVLGRRLLDRVTVELTPPGGDAISQDGFVNGVAHSVTPDNWVTEFFFTSATAYPTDFAKWDVGTWDTSAWAVA